jgi:uncharacterized protein (TIRG00374 family)
VNTFIKLLVALALIALILWQLGGVAPLVAAFQDLQWGFVAALIVLTLADRALMAFKWLLLLRGRGIELGYGKALTIYCVASFWGQVLPMTVGGDVVRLWLTSRVTARFPVVAASIAMERLLGFVAALLAALVGLVILGEIVDLGGELAGLWWAGVAVVVAGIAAFWLSLRQRLFDVIYGAIPARLASTKLVRRIRDLHEAYLDYRGSRGALQRFFLLTLLEQVAPVVFVWLAARAIGVDLGMLVAAAVVPLATLITRVPISLAGIGVFEGAFMLLLPLAGVAAADAVSMALLDRVIQVVAMAPWWLAMALGGKTIKPPEITSDAPRAPS